MVGESSSPLKQFIFRLFFSRCFPDDIMAATGVRLLILRHILMERTQSMCLIPVAADPYIHLQGHR